MRKLLLTFTAMLFCSIASFAQTQISTKEQFLAIQANGNYILTADINLGDRGDVEGSAIIPSFSGTFDGNGKTITYRASFTVTGDNQNFGLFGSVGGTGRINNLNVNADVTMSGTGSSATLGLICGFLSDNGQISHCNVSGNINSTAAAAQYGNSSTGLIIGNSEGNLMYSTASGNLVGTGFVGGLVGSMGTVLGDAINWPIDASIKGCYFTGSVTAINSNTTEGYRSFGGGICGYMMPNAKIELCVAEAVVVTGENAKGLTTSGWSVGGEVGSWFGYLPKVANNYCSGTINGEEIDTDAKCVNSNRYITTSGNYNPGTENDCEEGITLAECIVAKLNEARCPNARNCDENFYFDVINGKVVLIIGQQQDPDQPETPAYAYYRTIKNNGIFNVPTTWEASVDGNEPWVQNVTPEQNTTANIIISAGHTVYVNHDLVITGSYKIIDNQGVLQITQQGQLINETNDNVPGIVEIVSPQKETQAWTFIGAPFQNGYKLETIVPVPGNDADGISDISVKKYDYTTANWKNDWAWVGTTMKAGEGYFGYPFYGGVVTFTTYGDVCTWDNTNERYVIGSYNYNRTPLTVTSLNNDVVTVEETITAQSNGGYWMALSNPYPAKLKVSKFLSENTGIQGGCTYGYNGTSWDIQGATTGDIAMTEGFFVNMGSTGPKTITFNKGQLSYNNPNLAKASANEFIKLTLINGDKKVRAYLAHNEEAEQGYDIFDANKMFAPTEIAEPYFVTDGIALMKEEFAELPYYATMNVRSFADDTVSFVVNNIPEGLAVSIIDGENVIDMVEGGVYTTEILTGENADRFKVLIKKSVSISDVEELEVNITNNNRHISIETTETDLQVEVYNALGQKVLSTKDRNFTLNQVSAGAYLIKAFNNKASKTQKIVVE